MSKRKKEESSIELIISTFLGLAMYSKTNNLKKSFTIVLLSFIILISISFTIKYIKRLNYKKVLLNSGIDIVDKMNGQEFEKFLLVHFEKLGYKVSLTPATNDYGADLILIGDEKIVVQAKRWASKIGIEAIQQIIGAKEYYKANKCIVATNNFFTPNAENLAKSSNVELWNRNKLLEIMNKSNGREIAQEAINQKDISKRVICAKCGSEMVLREGKYGNFYGCSMYPKCRFTKEV